MIRAIESMGQRCTMEYVWKIAFSPFRSTCSALLISAATSSGSIQPGRRRWGSASRNCSRCRCSTSSIPKTVERTLDQNRKVRSGGQALAFENRYLCKDGSYQVAAVERHGGRRAPGHLLRRARHHRAQAGGRRARAIAARVAGRARRSEGVAGDIADLHVLQENPRR